MLLLKKITILLCTICFMASCKPAVGPAQEKYLYTQQKLQELLDTGSLAAESRFAVINQIASNMFAEKDYSGVILFLTNYVDKNKTDEYNAYWLLMTALAYIQTNAVQVAEFYFDRILGNYNDLVVKGKSVHLVCLENLIQISTSHESRIMYYTQLITRFAASTNPTPIYFYLAQEYENIGEWEKSLRSYTQFLVQPDAVTAQVAGVPDAYAKARKFIDFTDSSKDWTFESLDALTQAVKRAIDNYDWRSLDRYKSKVNFFAMSWKQNETDENSQDSFSMRSFMLGNRIRYNAELDESSTPNEAYLRTWGWSPYMPVWYLYFRKVNFPLDPEIHGTWEWAGIYYGEKL